MPLLTEFEDFPKAKEDVGTILAAYGEIEFALMGILAATLFDDDAARALRVLFRIRGEAARIEVCDGLLRKPFETMGLAPKWDNAVGAMRHCKNIRNNYAHCHWQVHDQQLWFLDLDIAAKSREEPIALDFWKQIDEPLVRKQVRYLEYALDLLYWLHGEIRKKVGKKPIRVLSEPKSIPAPPPYIQES